jgi:hypothetical protein
MPSTCFDSVQGAVAWNYQGDAAWNPDNVNALCAGAESSQQPAWCFLHVMFGGVDWGGGTNWEWQNALDLCKGTFDAAGRIACFKGQIASGVHWTGAIAACNP